MSDDDGVSTVLGAILVFGLLVVTLVSIQVNFVPVWDREREASHMQALAGQLASLKADLDRLADNRSTSPVAQPLLLARPSGFSFLSGSALPAEASLAPAAAGSGFTATSPQLRILSRNGQQLFAGGESWQAVAGNTVSDVAAVHNLRVRIAEPASHGTNDSVAVAITDAAGRAAGRVDIVHIDHELTYTLELRTYAASSATTAVTIVQEEHSKGSPPAYLYLDLLRRDLQFAQVLAAAAPPFRLDITRNGMDADHTIAYTAQVADGGTVLVGQAGLVVPDYAATLPGGSLIVAAPNQRYPAQTYVLEHGGLLLVQPDGAAMAVGPALTATVGAGQVSLSWTVPALSVPATTVAGTGAASVQLQPAGARTELTAAAASVTFTLATRHGAVWADHLAAVMEAAGLTVGPCASGNPAGLNACVAADAAQATLTVYGLQASASSTLDDITLTLKGATIQAAIRPGAAG
jgi:hypothetical protein